MSLLDIIIIGIIISFTLISAAWGVIRQVIALGGLIAGIWLAGALNNQVAGALGFISDPKVAKGLAFVLIVVVVSLIASTIASVLYFVTGLLFLGLLDHALGALLGFIQGILATGVFLVAALTVFPDWTQPQLAQSFLADKLVGAFTTVALLVAPQDLKEIVERARARI